MTNEKPSNNETDRNWSTWWNSWWPNQQKTLPTTTTPKPVAAVDKLRNQLPESMYDLNWLDL